MTNPTLTEYLDNITAAERAEYDRIRKIVTDIVPEAQDAVSYGMPSFTHHGKSLIWVGVFKKHMTLFPGTIKFTPENPLDTETIEQLVRGRLAKIQ